MPNIYQLNDRDEITAKLAAVPTDGSNYCLSDVDYDFDNYIIVIGVIDKDHVATYVNPPKERPYSELVRKYNMLKADNERQAAAIIDLMNLVTGGK